MSDLIEEAIADVKRAGAAVGANETDDMGAFLAAVSNLALVVSQRAEDVRTGPAVNVEAAIRKGLLAAVPEFTGLWRSQGRAWMIMAVAVLVTVVASGASLVSFHIGKSVGGATEAKWAAWCANPGHITVHQQNSFCEIPVTRPSGV